MSENTEIQNQIWKILPNELKDKYKQTYYKTAHLPVKESYDLGVLHTFENIFGIHNLYSTNIKSDTAMQHLNIGDIVKIINTDDPVLKNRIGIIKEYPHEGETRYRVWFSGGNQWTLLEPNQLKLYSDDKEFTIGSKVKFKFDTEHSDMNNDDVYEINDIEEDAETPGHYIAQLKNNDKLFSYFQLEALYLLDDQIVANYSQETPKFAINDKVILLSKYLMLNMPCVFTIKNIIGRDYDGVFLYSVNETHEYIRETMIESCHITVKTLEESLPGASKVIDDNFFNLIGESNPENKMEKDKCEKCGANMQQCMNADCQNYPVTDEKELNLYELLKGYEGEEFYSLLDGNVIFRKIEVGVVCQYHTYHYKGHLMGNSLDGICLLYPSRELYEKYPLDAYSAWMEWYNEKRKNIIKLEFIAEHINDDGDKDSTIITDEIRFSSKNEMDRAFEELNKVIQQLHK